MYKLFSTGTRRFYREYTWKASTAKLTPYTVYVHLQPPVYNIQVEGYVVSIIITNQSNCLSTTHNTEQHIAITGYIHFWLCFTATHALRLYQHHTCHYHT